jgi:hypothetical protein
MEKKILMLSVSAAVLLVLASFSSVIGTDTTQSSEEIRSPLFAIRTQRSVVKESQQSVQTSYLGKGLSSNLFLNPRPSLGIAIDRTVRLLSQNPAFFAKFIKTISSHPRVIALLQENDISMTQFQTQLNRMKNDPSLFIEEIRSVEPRLLTNQINTPLPLGLNTSNALGCIITAIVMIPIALIITLIVVVFTLRIFQCLKIDEVMQQIFDQILQELYPSGYNI